MNLNLPTPSRAVAIGAHPDDIEFGSGASLAKWAAGGCELLHIVCTDGSKGSWDPGEDIAQLVVKRQAEQRAASIALGGRGEVVFLGSVDGELRNGTRQRSQVAYWIRRFRPDVVLGHDPWQRYRLHPDHRRAGFVTTDAIVAARDAHFFREHDLEPHRPSTLLLFEPDNPDHVEDVGGFADRKVAALLSHKSQLRSTMQIDDPNSTMQLDAFRTRVVDELARHGELAGIAQGEAFKRIDDL